jgi:glyoxylase-like metal-dependent hydrolase (beta-lactamase superfamily II)
MPDTGGNSASGSDVPIIGKTIKEESLKTYQIYPLSAGVVKVPTGSSLPCICYLIKGEDTLILVDSGPPDNEKHIYPVAAEKHGRELLIENLAQLGVKPEDIRILVNTHLHWDHCYNNDLFPNARVYVQQKEIQSALNPLPYHYQYYEAIQAGYTPGWLKSATQFEAIDGDYDMCDGIRLVTLPGHSPGFQGVLVNTTSGRYLIASDAIPFLANWEDREYGMPRPSMIYTDLAAYYDSFRKMISITNYVLPGHDEKAFDRPVYP